MRGRLADEPGASVMLVSDLQGLVYGLQGLRMCLVGASHVNTLPPSMAVTK
jgi:hypothetical protein